MQTAIVVRAMDLDYTAVPRAWCANSLAATGISNGVNMLFPLGERFFIRSVRHYLERIDDPDLLEQVRRFMGQEVRHGMEHERFFEQLEAHGYEIRSFLEWYERVAFGVIEKRCPPELNLAVTVALEHFTAMFAERALTQRTLLRELQALKQQVREENEAVRSRLEALSPAPEVHARPGAGSGASK